MALMTPVPHRFIPGPPVHFTTQCVSCKAWSAETNFRSRHLPRISWLDILPLAPALVLVLLYLLHL